MMDAKLVFCSLTECTNSKSLGVLPKAEYLEAGAGRQKFIEIFSDGGFTSGAEVVSVQLKTGTTSPGANSVMSPILDIAASALSVAGQKAKVPLPSIGLSNYISLYFYAETALTAGGKLTAILTIDG